MVQYVQWRLSFWIINEYHRTLYVYLSNVHCMMIILYSMFTKVQSVYNTYIIISYNIIHWELSIDFRKHITKHLIKPLHLILKLILTVCMNTILNLVVLSLLQSTQLHRLVQTKDAVLQEHRLLHLLFFCMSN